jgi:hypothetical protein
MANSKDTIKFILNDLTSVHENLLALSEDIWNSIDHNDNQKLEEGCLFKKQFNALLDIFEHNAEEISALISQFTGIREEPPSGIKAPSENKRIIAELDKSEPHSLNENFTYKRPYAFVLEEHAYTELMTWKDLYIQVCRHLIAKDKNRFDRLADNDDFISTQNRKYYSADKSACRTPYKITDKTFIEVNLSANHFVKLIKELFEYFKIDAESMKLYLRQDRNA